MSAYPNDTIAAIATPSGRGGVGVIRISGKNVPAVAHTLLGKLPKPRYATYSNFVDQEGELLDQGLALYFPAPNSFTGEDVLELQGHGGAVILDALLAATLKAGARMARAGEFSERAFLNNKIDLTQAEAIADLIDSASLQAARCALRSLQGDFSKHIHHLVDELIWLRSYIEAGIDFVEEEIDLLQDGVVVKKIETLKGLLKELVSQAKQGHLLKEGMRIVLVGEPNVGKSSLLNCLSGRETAIVTPIAGTTRDVVHDSIQLDGMPLHITDTAGIRETTDPVELEGIKRTKQALKEADLILLLLDDRYDDDHSYDHLLEDIDGTPLIIRNKIDLSGHEAGLNKKTNVLYLSAKTQAGVTEFKQFLRDKAGLSNEVEGTFMARRRHLDALDRAGEALMNALERAEFRQNELLAEELRIAQQALSEITGEFSADDLLGSIFSNFCIGK